jgi:arylformamidase
VRYHDISFPITDRMPGFPGDPAVRVARKKKITRSNLYNVSSISLSSHSGTHVDPPLHFLPDGLPVDQLDLGILNGPVRVVEVPPNAVAVGPEAFRSLGPGDSRVLFKTANSPRWEKEGAFFDDYVALTPGAADEAVRRQVRLVGIDSLSIESMGSSTYPVHRTLLGKGILILEGLRLAGIAEGVYDLQFLPLRIAGGDGAPGRALLVER